MTDESKAIDRVASRITAWTVAGMTVVGLFTGLIGWGVKKATDDLRLHLANSDAAIAHLSEKVTEVAQSDSTRNERLLDIVSIAVVAVVSPAGSSEQRNAVEDLKRRQRVIP